MGMGRNKSTSTMVPISKLVPWADNPRVNAAAVERLAGSIRAFGFLVPIVARRRDSRVLAGHARLKAAQQLGLTEVPVVWCDLDDLQAEAFALADNKLHELAQWDEDSLSGLLRRLQDEDIDLFDLGWSESELQQLLADDDELAEVRESMARRSEAAAKAAHTRRSGDVRATLVTMILAVPVVNEIEAILRREQQRDGCSRPDALLRLLRLGAALEEDDAAENLGRD